MSKNQIVGLARSVIDGKPLSEIVNAHGYDIAEKVYKETVKRSWQVVSWIRKVR